jgi:metallo-beta-lactamase class B
MSLRAAFWRGDDLAMRVCVCALLCTAACARGPSVHSPPGRTAGVTRSGSSGVAATETIRPGLTVRSIAADAWVVTHEEAHSSNVLVARLPDGTLLLCSSPFDTDTTRALVAWLGARLAPARIVAINTHWHMDGTGGNAAYHEAGVATYASTHTQALSRERGARMRREAAAGLPAALADHVRATAVVAAEHTFDESRGLTLTFGGERVEVTFPGPAHSQDNVVVYLPARRILFGGCMLKVGDSLGYLGDASLDTWEPALARLAALRATVVVPGHGRTGGPEIIANTLRLVRAALRSQRVEGEVDVRVEAIQQASNRSQIQDPPPPVVAQPQPPPSPSA